MIKKKTTEQVIKKISPVLNCKDHVILHVNDENIMAKKNIYKKGEIVLYSELKFLFLHFINIKKLENG